MDVMAERKGKIFCHEKVEGGSLSFSRPLFREVAYCASFRVLTSAISFTVRVGPRNLLVQVLVGKNREHTVPISSHPHYKLG